MDIELRWLERCIEVPPTYNLGYPPKHPTERVLQYRTRIMTMGLGYQQAGAAGSGNNTLVAYERPMGWTWSEWTDIPVVTA